MPSNWQSWITLAIIVLTATIFLWRAVARHRRKGSGPPCGHDCGGPSSSLTKKKSGEE